ncbi:hypothetical protein Nepgr_033710 [Nepenthes gracilis]|uniref:Uncharacterized protein n=1 Tax=Nepenthes gracilis TaxID=150966 RepID=A0AAD3TMF4_NEPGR|nr:hypothetical protein Nepgr_033710 [Nepenthes gracilis]
MQQRSRSKEEPLSADSEDQGQLAKTSRTQLLIASKTKQASYAQRGKAARKDAQEGDRHICIKKEDANDSRFQANI